MPATSSASSDARIGFLARRLDRIETRAATIERPAGLIARLAACHALGLNGGSDWAQAARRHFASDALLMKAASGPAVTSSAGWAGDLVQPMVLDIAANMLAETVFAQLRAVSGLSFELGQGGVPRVPSHQPTPSGGFVGEAAAIAVAQLVMTAATLGPLKAASILGLTKELMKSSPANLEKTFGVLMAEDLSLAIDSVLLNVDAATAASPAGLLLGAVAVTPGVSLAEDIAALLNAIAPAHRPVILAGVGTAGAVSVLAPGLAVPLIVAPMLAAGVLVAVDATAFASALGPPAFAISEEPALHFESAPAPISATGSPNTVAAPVYSAFQQALICLRTIIDVNWTLRRANAVAVLTDAAWVSAGSASALQADEAAGRAHLPAPAPSRTTRARP